MTADGWRAAGGVFAAVLVTTVSVCADEILVPGDAVTIQAGLTMAQPGDEVVLVNALYSGLGTTNLDFGGKAITLRSQSGNPDNCTIDAGGTGRIMIFTGGETSAARIEGIEFKNGSALEGGAILFALDSNPTFENCRFTGNTSSGDGGAVIMFASSPTFRSCEFTMNTSTLTGGAVWTQNSAPVFHDCTFTENASTSNGGAIRVSGGAMDLVDCDFIRNTAGSNVVDQGKNAGAVDLVDATVSIVNCNFQENAARTGGAIYASRTTGLLVNCIFNGNRAEGSFTQLVPDPPNPPTPTPQPEGEGGAIFAQFESFLTLLNPTMHANYARCGAGGVHVEPTSEVSIHNGIIWNNERGTEIVFEICNCIEIPDTKEDDCEPTPDLPADLNGEGLLTVGYSIVTEMTPGDGNLTDDPLFSDPLGGDGTAGTEDDDLRLMANSPAIDSGDNTEIVKEGITTDIDGGPRRQDDPDVVDGGLGRRPIVDRGVYEIDDCTADLDGDNVIGFGDLLLILNKFGDACAACPEDLTGDGMVGFDDIVMLLSQWNEAPTCT